MRGLIIWACTNCRSVMELYREIQMQLHVPVRIALYVYKEGGMRPETGFRPGEFEDVETTFVGEDYQAGIRLMDECKGYYHVFTIFQRAPKYYRLILEAHRRGEHVGIAAESPCNMSHGIRWIAKEAYDRLYLPLYARRVIKSSDFFINYSGDSKQQARSIGWDNEKILPFGYFPPPLQGSHCIKRERNEPFLILSTGILSKYRGADVLVDALCILKKRGIDFRAVITQDGELLQLIKQKAEENELPIEFPGFIPMDRLIRLYETCSVFVGAGRSEPWGMRLNDALNCGAPLVVSKGMGGVALVERYGCGESFESGSAIDLANKLTLLASDKCRYLEVADKAYSCANLISPKNKASEFIALMRKFWDMN